MTVAVGQYVYELTHSAFHLGYVGLALFLPKFSFALLTGHVADRFDRRLVIMICRGLQLLVMVGLVFFALAASPRIEILYLLLFLMGTANAFEGPAAQSIVPHLVPKEHFANAVTWISTFFQSGLMIGPAVGGWLYGAVGGALNVFLIIAVIRLVATFLMREVRVRTGRLETSELSWKTLLAGLRYVFEYRVLLGAISLDLFAVLFGGAVALMPIYANDILHVGPTGLGFLRAAPAFGGALMALAFTHLPPMRKAGITMLWCVVLFGVMTILFGVSRSFPFSLACLFVLGAADMVSVVIRHTLVQMKTPPEMRGRVSAVNIIFIGASNELGEFESGLTAGWFGTVPAVVIGGLGTLAVVGLWAWRFPELRRYRRLDEGVEPTGRF